VPGTHALKPSVVRPGGISLDGVIPETVEVVIRLQETGATGELPQVPDVEATAAAITPTATLTVTAAGMTIPSTIPAVTPTVTALPAETPATATPSP
jgi:hypothetical protein